MVAQREQMCFYAAFLMMIGACVGPIVYHYGLLTNPMGWSMLAAQPFGALVAICGTAVSLPTLTFGRNYLHGEYMFGRFSALCVALLLGFNLVATSPDIHSALGGWTLFGFASTFLIGMYNERHSVRSNATYAFAAYKIGDLAMLLAAATTLHGMYVPEAGMGALAAAGVLVAAWCKSSQFPMTPLFARSMEGPTPSSALGYAGLSAHIGIVLLATTMPLWYPYTWAQVSLACVGLTTAVVSSLVARIRADRKGAIAYATSASLGVMMLVLAAGFKTTALYLCIGHAAFRMVQILRAPNIITDTSSLRAALGGKRPWPRPVPEWTYRLAWMCRRFDTDFQFISMFRSILRDDQHKARTHFSPFVQWILAAVIVYLAGLPFTGLTHEIEHLLDETTKESWPIGLVSALLYWVACVVLVRMTFTRVLDNRRFHWRSKSTTSSNGIN